MFRKVEFISYRKFRYREKYIFAFKFSFKKDLRNSNGMFIEISFILQI